MNDRHFVAATCDALLFDFGGVLVDIDFQRTFATWAELAGVAPQAVSERFAFDAAYEAHERGEIDGAHYFALLRQSLGIDLSDAQFLAGWNALFLEALPGVAELLPVLAARWPLHLFSNTNRLHHDCWRTRHAGLLAPFSQVFCSHALGERKPTRAAFDQVVRRIGVPAGRIVFFDDLAENVAGARQAGLQAWQVRSVGDIRAVLGEGQAERAPVPNG